MSKLFSLLAVLLLLAGVAAAQSQSKAQVMVLGTYHFANPNLDAVKANFPDHLGEKKQQEIAEVLEALARFKPTKILLETPPENTQFQAHYQAYLKDEFKLNANESQQLGFRLARRFGHKQVYLVDHQIGMDFDALMKAAQETGNKAFLELFQKTLAQVQVKQKEWEQMTVRAALAEMNEPALQEQTRDFYLQLARVRSKDQFVGADVLTAWYQRNFRIFTNISQTIDSPQDRVLVIFGQGHAYYLREAIKSCPDLQLVEPNEYLKK
ncbi:MAG: hypothetical protein HYR56_27420 [Acidobacteria bacterium]|nr:hypothetical protein [Acidobacteriota bacterium]MBI3426681.1 hypothetical protein [Acidobacteriota bacterium]